MPFYLVLTRLLCGLRSGPDASYGARSLVEAFRPTGKRLMSTPTGSYPLPQRHPPDAAPAVAGAAFILVRPWSWVLSGGSLIAHVPLASRLQLLLSGSCRVG
jgi:hypothetical protein